VLGEVTHDSAFANDFFRRYVEGHEVVDYARLLAPAGFLLRKAQPGRGWMGASIADDSASVVVTQSAIEGGSFYRAGIDRGDRIFAADGVPTPTADSLAAVVRRHAAGETLRLDVKQRTGRHEVAVTLVENPAVEIVPYEAAGMPVTDAIREFRQSWLGSKAGAQ
jgi:predicted metalloprotease with PDZ domain